MPNYIFSGETLDGKTVEGDLVHDGQDRTYILMDVMDHIKRDDYSVYMVEVRPSSVRLNTEIICDQAEQIDNLKAEVERLRGDGWISVKERLPEKNAGVTIYTPHGGVDTRALGMCDDDPNGLWYCYKGADEPLRFNEVTHWRPLPEPPRGENGENNEI